MATVIEKKIVEVTLSKTVGKKDSYIGNRELIASISWENGEFKGINIRQTASSGYLCLDEAATHAFYELVNELNTLTNTPPAGCEPV